jgi:hypothetical protein
MIEFLRIFFNLFQPNYFWNYFMLTFACYLFAFGRYNNCFNFLKSFLNVIIFVELGSNDENWLIVLPKR